MECVQHVITSHVESEECSKIVALLPPLFPCYLEYLLSRNVLGAIAVMGIVLADRAGVCAAGRAGGSLATDVDGSDKH